MGCLVFIVIVLACVWLMGQFTYAVALTAVIAIYLLCAILGKFSNSQMADKLFRWINKNPRNFGLAFVIFFVCCALIGVAIGASQLDDSDISWESVIWYTDESFVGIEYDEKHLGALVTNSSNKTVTVNIKAEFYDGDMNYLETSGDNWTGAIVPNGSRFVEIDFPEDADRYRIVLAEQKKTRDYVAVTAGFDSDCDVVFSVDEEESDILIRNNTNFTIASCGCTYIYYDDAGYISYIQTFSTGRIPANKKVAEYFKLEEPPVDYASKDVIFFAFYKK